MNPLLTHEHHQIKKNVPELKAGDRVKIHQKIKEGAKERIQVFEGLVIKTQHGRGINGTFTVRRISLGVGVEKTFPLHLPSIVKFEKLKSAKVRRAKLFYVRELIGKRANRLKKEKEDKAVWEDVVVEEVKKDPEQEKIEREAEQVGKDKAEMSNDKSSSNDEGQKEKAKIDETEVKDEEEVEAKKESSDAPEEVGVPTENVGGKPEDKKTEESKEAPTSNTVGIPTGSVGKKTEEAEKA